MLFLFCAENAPPSVMPEDTKVSLDDVKVLDLWGKEIPVTDLWKERKAVIAFARHFGYLTNLMC